MRTFIAFLKKEWMEQIRSSRLTILFILFVLFGIMNPATAKLTPWLLEMMADSLAESGMTITDVTVTALDSWMQFFKNIPMFLMAFILLEGSIFTKEYRSGTLILSLTKGLERYKVLVSKTVTVVLLWSAGFWMSFGITYAYSAYYWDNSVASSLGFSALCWWVFGLWVICLLVLFSVLFQTGTGVLAGTGATVAVSYLVGMIPKIAKYLPTLLTDGNSLIYGLKEPREYVAAMIVAAVTGVASLAGGWILFNKKQL